MQLDAKQRKNQLARERRRALHDECHGCGKVAKLTAKGFCRRCQKEYDNLRSFCLTRPTEKCKH